MRAVLVMVSSDPAESGRAEEALRMAAGLCVWESVTVRICLRGPAVSLLEAEDERTSHWSLLREKQTPVGLYAGGSGEVREASGARELSTVELARWMAESDCVFHF